MGAKGVAGGGGVSKESTMAWLRHDLPVSSFALPTPGHQGHNDLSLAN